MTNNGKTRRPIQRKNSSFLEWHYKKPSPEELENQYECFTEEEWAFHYQASKESTTLSVRKKNDVAVMNGEAKRLACEDCQLPYQLEQMKLGRCHPIQDANTPLDILGWVDESK
jgi:hypothetical protein